MSEEKQLQFLVPEHLFLFYASGGAGKSTLIAHMAAHIWKEKGLKTRVVGADGGGTKPFQSLMKKGIVDYWPVDLWDQDIWTTLDLATKGWWPERVDIPNSKLLPPYKELQLCPFCKAGTASPAKCTSCGKPIPAGATMERQLLPLNGFEQVGGMGFESIAAWSFNIMQRLRDVELPANAFSIKDEKSTELIKQSAQNHYGIAQNYIQKWVGNTRKLPVWSVAWTTLELRGGDDGYGKPIYGPQLPGKKLTALCTPWFTDVIHLELEPQEKKDVNGQQVVDRVMYLADHFPPDTKPFGFKAKTSVPGMPTRLPCPAGKNAMSLYFEEVQKAYEKQEKELLG
jgi:hypothetical protein